MIPLPLSTAGNDASLQRVAESQKPSATRAFSDQQSVISFLSLLIAEG
jgi:hypothetical protein